MKPCLSGMICWFLGIMMSMSLAGCVSETLNQYAEYDYGAERGTRLCHPFWDCGQGQWVDVGKSEIDTIVDFASCESKLDRYGDWIGNTVVQGMEAKHCMEVNGYVLKYPNPLRQ